MKNYNHLNFILFYLENYLTYNNKSLIIDLLKIKKYVKTKRLERIEYKSNISFI